MVVRQNLKNKENKLPGWGHKIEESPPSHRFSLLCYTNYYYINENDSKVRCHLFEKGGRGERNVPCHLLEENTETKPAVKSQPPLQREHYVPPVQWPVKNMGWGTKHASLGATN